MLNQKFTGHERDDESGLDYFGARYYAGSQGRFISPDPWMASARVLQPQSWNRHTYVLNNPLRYVDQFGLQEKYDPKKHEEEVRKAQKEADEIGLPRVKVEIHPVLTLLNRLLTFGGRLRGPLLQSGPALPPDDVVPEEGSEKEEEERREELDRLEGIEPIIAVEMPANIPDINAKAQTALEDILLDQTPQLNATTTPEMASEALDRVAEFEGTAEQKANLYQSFAIQISHRTGDFVSVPLRGTDGSYVFLGSRGELLVINPQGTLYRGSIQGDGGTFVGGSTFKPNYSNLTIRTARK